jgi:hypothetical protein
MKAISALFIFILFFSHISCSTYRVVPLIHGVDSEGEIKQFYAVTYNNVIIPEYVIDERGTYPTEKQIAWGRFLERKEGIRSEIREKYRLPNDFTNGLKQFILGLGFLIVFPVSYPIYAASSEKGERSPSCYFNLMVRGRSGNLPVLRDEFSNF